MTRAPFTRRHPLVSRGIAASFLLLAACSSDDPTDDSWRATTGDAAGPSDDAGPDTQVVCAPEDASAPAPSAQCTDLATAYCTQEARCDTTHLQESFAGDMGACIASALLSCPDVSETGTSNTPASVEACATALGQLPSCAAFASYLLAHDRALCDASPGTLASGADCNDDSQCASGFCAVAFDPESAGAGACGDRPAAPACVKNAQCPDGQLCNAAGVCATAGGPGAPCDSSVPALATQPCQAGFYCDVPQIGADGGIGTNDGGAASPPGTCTALAGSGEPCNRHDDINDCADGLYCSSRSTCAPLQFAAVGAACGSPGIVCAGASCLVGDAGGSVCTAPAPNGAACQDDSGCQSGNCSAGSCAPRPVVACHRPRAR